MKNSLRFCLTVAILLLIAVLFPPTWITSTNSSHLENGRWNGNDITPVSKNIAGGSESPVASLSHFGTGGTRELASTGNNSFKTVIRPFIEKHCMDCHGDGADEGDVVLDDIEDVNPSNAELWKKIWEQVALKEMPPRDEEQPAAKTRHLVSTWITDRLETELKPHGGFDIHRQSEKGNHLDHDLLFGPLPNNLKPTSSPARLWRIHPQEHLVRLNALIDHEPEHDPERPGLRSRGDFHSSESRRRGEGLLRTGSSHRLGWRSRFIYDGTLRLPTDGHNCRQTWP